MLPLALALALSAAPAASCHACSLLAQSERLPDPPLPELNAPEADKASARELELRISDLQRRINAINVNFPHEFLLLGYVGYGLAPSLLSGLLTLLFGLQSGLDTSSVIGGAAVQFGMGLLGVLTIVYAYVQGNAVVAQRRAERDVLIRERDGLDAELRRLRQGDRAATAPLLVLRF